MLKKTFMKKRCPWVPINNDLYTKYHDEEWGVPVHDDFKHFEFLILEGAQAGLTWESILKRRENYRRALANFNPEIVALFDDKDIERLLFDPGLIRNRLKITAAINNAKQFLLIQKEFGSFDQYIWRFVKQKTIKHQIRKLEDYPIYNKEAETLARDLKRRGFSFVGPTIMYAHMQACGLVNDHSMDCFRRDEVGLC